MSSSPQLHSQWRFPGARLEGTNPAVLRFKNGRTTGANLQVISLSGGLLSLPEAVDQGSQVRLIFLTGAGAVLGGAEMLPPIRHDLQPFRFVSLADDDQRRLGTLVGQHAVQSQNDQAWIEKFRAASAQQNQPQPIALQERAIDWSADGRFDCRRVRAPSGLGLEICLSHYGNDARNMTDFAMKAAATRRHLRYHTHTPVCIAAPGFTGMMVPGLVSKLSRSGMEVHAGVQPPTGRSDGG